MLGLGLYKECWQTCGSPGWVPHPLRVLQRVGKKQMYSRHPVSLSAQSAERQIGQKKIWYSKNVGRCVEAPAFRPGKERQQQLRRALAPVCSSRHKGAMFQGPRAYPICSETPPASPPQSPSSPFPANISDFAAGNGLPPFSCPRRKFPAARTPWDS